MKPSDFKPMHNGERFQVRVISVAVGRSEWQVYADGVQHIALCSRADIADMVAKCLNDAAGNEGDCYCHERDGSYVCAVCYNKGLRGHMQR